MIQIVNTFFHMAHMLYLPKVLSDTILHMLYLPGALFDTLHTTAAMELILSLPGLNRSNAPDLQLLRQQKNDSWDS